MKIDNFQLMAKPSGSLCNLDCAYCFYLEKEQLYPERKQNWRMTDATLEKYITSHIASQQGDVVDFLWQGGEPTLLGIEFYLRAVKLQQKYHGAKTINNFFQTNGVNLNKEWATFFREHHFLVGVSIDGDRASHDAYRMTRAGKSTFDAVLEGIALLRRYHVQFNTLSVINDVNVRRPVELYRFLKSIGSRYMQFIPLTERRAMTPDANGLTLISPDFSGQSHVEAWSVPPKAWGEFLNAIFNEWATRDIGKIFVMNFEQTLAQLYGMPAACVISETCGANLILEANGDVYACDHYVYPANKLGNIHTNTLTAMVNSPQNLAFSQRKAADISKDCLSCSFLQACNGGCPKQRFALSSEGKPNQHYLCEGFRLHLGHVIPALHRLYGLLNKGASPTRIKREMQAMLQNR